MKCKYDENTEATATCVICRRGLCEICGYTEDESKYCNECWEDIQQQLNEDRIAGIVEDMNTDKARDMIAEHDDNYFNNQDNA